MGTRWHAFDFPLREPDHDAVLVLPTDLTRDEANRLCDFVIAISSNDADTEQPK